MRKNNKIINFVILFIFFFVIFTFFNVNTRTKVIISFAMSLILLIIPFVLTKINKIHADHYLKKIRRDAVKGLRITPEEANNLFYLDENTCIRINRSQLEKCNISQQSKEILILISQLESS